MATLSDFMPRDTETLQLVLAGRTNKAIAQKYLLTKKLLNSTLIMSTQRLARERAYRQGRGPCRRV